MSTLRAVERLQHGGGDALPFILYFEMKGTVANAQAHVSNLAAGMSVDVGKAFLKHAKDGQLHLARYAIEIRRDIERGFNAAALGESVDIPDGSRSQPCLL